MKRIVRGSRRLVAGAASSRLLASERPLSPRWWPRHYCGRRWALTGDDVRAASGEGRCLDPRREAGDRRRPAGGPRAAAGVARLGAPRRPRALLRVEAPPEPVRAPPRG